MTGYPVLIASSDIENRNAISAVLAEDGLDTICASTVKETKEALAKMPVSIIICDWQLPDGSFKDLIHLAKKEKPEVLVVVTSRTGHWEERLAAKQLGAFEVIPSPCQRSNVEWALITALRAWRQRAALPSVIPSERRRSPRFLLRVPVVVRGESLDKKSFSEETVTVDASAHGAVVSLAAKVASGQALTLVNPQNWDERVVRIARFVSPSGTLAQIAVEFPEPAPEFLLFACPWQKS
jgi:DNA-binding NtrC family response regulator